MADKGEYRGIYVALVDSWEFQELSACARSCLLVLKLKLGKAGIDVFYPETLPRYTGHTLADCEAAMRELEERDWIRTERNIVWLRNGLKFDPSEPLASPNGRTGIKNHLASLPSLAIVDEFARYYGLSESPSEAPSRPLRSPMPSTEDGRRKTETETLPASKLTARDAIEDQADEIIRLANRGMADNPAIGDGCHPIHAGHGSRQTVLDWLADGIPADLAGRVVYQRAREYQPAGHRRQITTMRYFDGAVRDEYDREQAKHTSAPKTDEHDRNRSDGRSATRGAPAQAPEAAIPPKPDKYAHLVRYGDGRAAV